MQFIYVHTVCREISVEADPAYVSSAWTESSCNVAVDAVDGLFRFVDNGIAFNIQSIISEIVVLFHSFPQLKLAQPRSIVIKKYVGVGIHVKQQF
jgi:hypothetical protein